MEDCWCGNLIKHAKNLKLKSKGELYIHVQNDCFVFMCRIHWFWAAVCLEMVLWDCTNGPSCGCPLMCRCQHSKKTAQLSPIQHLCEKSLWPQRQRTTIFPTTTISQSIRSLFAFHHASHIDHMIVIYIFVVLGRRVCWVNVSVRTDPAHMHSKLMRTSTPTNVLFLGSQQIHIYRNCVHHFVIYLTRVFSNE